MSAEIISTIDGIVTVKITDKLTYPDLIELQKSVIGIIDQLGGIKVLIICEDLHGWSKEGDWEKLSFQVENDPFINKMAIVGEEKWEEPALIFTCKGLRDFPIEYFQPHELTRAQAWLNEN
ncbi:STAS/SEC14 domain-containing protein [Methylobacter svalbardensis]|uniref:STAS/SEC14 domain-containing protein n=1 Tax=Methylobacter svalbardensis TaxID=3080016 RepID=UPI0030EC54FA